MLVELVGPEYTYPVQDAVVQVGRERKRTGPSGKAGFSSVPKDQHIKLAVRTDFASVSQEQALTGNTTWSVPINLPPLINDDELRNSIFWDGRANWRFERGTVIRVYFDYDERGGAALTESEKRRFEQDVLREFQSWFEDGERLGSFLRWGGQVDHELDANLIIRLVSDETFFARFTHYEDPETAPSHSPFFRFHNDYIVIAELWVRIDKLESRPSLYAQWFGRLAYLGRLSGRDVQRHESVMNWSDHAEQPTDLDRLMVKIKMHLPPLIPYNGAE